MPRIPEAARHVVAGNQQAVILSDGSENNSYAPRTPSREGLRRSRPFVMSFSLGTALLTEQDCVFKVSV